MIIHRTQKKNRKSIIEKGLIPQFKRKKNRCPSTSGHISASVNLGYFAGRFQPERFDYWRLENVAVIPCSCPVMRRKCKFAVKIEGTVSVKNLFLLEECYVTSKSF